MPDHRTLSQALLGSREIRFNNRQESIYPNLMRFCLDFKFKVLQLLLSPASETAAPARVVVMTKADFTGDPDCAITPAFTELEQLERYVADNQVDILHDYLFGLDELTNSAG
ncbi:hypothetical protein KO507_12755 [Gilvimarinus agarilyticus]|uniref:hypothetical protein n=1 Tax=unclassified Gilvimarinus TaxID=2642066 RepID=UPI001C098120|nr:MULTISPECIES: hypothetical protein [unclassified Gilvimarinus]MBU2886635.1 hypothetical protein [Gilvimarinus agarilyticus]MDO6571303.1 hypothetical protein [Gilvimarinus sp. 2_MG-2023]MDO6746322.1 hypothetical protein [Gilvimarinus sp. 1_MG-2023]